MENEKGLTGRQTKAFKGVMACQDHDDAGWQMTNACFFFCFFFEHWRTIDITKAWTKNVHRLTGPGLSTPIMSSGYCLCGALYVLPVSTGFFSRFSSSPKWHVWLVGRIPYIRSFPFHPSVPRRGQAFGIHQDKTLNTDEWMNFTLSFLLDRAVNLI